MFYSLLLLYFYLINDLSGANIITIEDIISLYNSESTEMKKLETGSSLL